MRIIWGGEEIEIQKATPGEEMGFGPEKWVAVYSKPDEDKWVRESIEKGMQEKIGQETDADKAKREKVYAQLKENRTTPWTKSDMASFCEMSVAEFNECVRRLKYEGRVKEESAEWCYGSEFCWDDNGETLYVWKCLDDKMGSSV